MPPVETIFREWYVKGGSLKHVEDRIEESCRRFEQDREAEAALKPCRDALAVNLMRLLRDHLRQFLADHEVPRDVHRYLPDAAVPLDGPGVSKATSDKIAAEVGGMAAGVAATTASVAAVVVGLVKIKVLLLLAFVDPILTVLAAAAALPGLPGVRQKRHAGRHRGGGGPGQEP